MRLPRALAAVLALALAASAAPLLKSAPQQQEVALMRGPSQPQPQPQPQQCTLIRQPHTPDSPLVFLHLPKVGGTSVREILTQSAALLGLNMCADLRLPHLLFDNQTFEPVHSCDILFGHLFYGIVEGYTRAKQPLYAVLLRDPLERVLSLYYYVLKYSEHYQYQYFSNTSLHDLIMRSEDRAGGKAEYRPDTLAVNVMTWWICGYDCNPRYMSLSTALLRAQHNLMNNIEVVGITEDMPAFLDALHVTVPFLSNITLPTARANRNDQKHTDTYASQRSPQEIAVLKKALFADRSLYRLAMQLVGRQKRCLASNRGAPVSETFDGHSKAYNPPHLED